MVNVYLEEVIRLEWSLINNFVLIQELLVKIFQIPPYHIIFHIVKDKLMLSVWLVNVSIS